MSSKRAGSAQSRAAKRRRLLATATALLSGGSVPAARRGYRQVARTGGALVQVPEMKYFDSLLAASTITASSGWTACEYDPATLNTLFVPIQGTGINNRVGRKVTVHKIRIQGQLTLAAQADQTAGEPAALVRLILVQDMQSNGTQAQGEELMDGSTGSTGAAVSAFQSLANFGRFRVLRDMRMTLQNPNASYDGTNVEQNGLVRPFKISISFKKPITVHFNATNGGTMADIVDNQFHIFANISSTQPTTLTYVSRVAFKDA